MQKRHAVNRKGQTELGLGQSASLKHFFKGQDLCGHMPEIRLNMGSWSDYNITTTTKSTENKTFDPASYFSAKTEDEPQH